MTLPKLFDVVKMPEDMSLPTRMRNAQNQYQRKIRKVLCVCSAGLLRSPTAAFILTREPFNFNTRAVGIDPEYALIVLDKVLLHWADDIICFDQDHMHKISEMLEEMPYGDSARLFCMDIEDNFCYRDDLLEKELTNKFKELYGFNDTNGTST